MNTDADINLQRRLPGPVGGAMLYANMLVDKRLRGHDVVSLIAPSFVTLRPQRLRSIYKKIRQYNGTVFLGSIGPDKAIMDYLTSPSCELRYSEYFIDGKPYKKNEAVLRENSLWQQGDIAGWCEELYDSVDGVTTALYEYHLAMLPRISENRLAYTGIPIDLDSIKPIEHNLVEDGRVKMFLGIKTKSYELKGADRIEAAAERLVKEYPEKCSLIKVKDLPYKEYLKAMRSADIVLDQLYSYTPATNALQAMAAGQATFSGGEDEYYKFIGEKEMKPVINCSPDDAAIYETLKNCILNPEIIINSGKIGRQFVRKHNDSELVARRHLEFWKSI